MSYDPTIPLVSHNIATDVGPMQINFSQANILFGLDHYPFNYNTTPTYRGYHTQITFPNLPLPNPIVAPSGTGCVLYPAADANDTGTGTQLYFQNATQTIQLTNNFINNSSTGSIQLPGGLFLMWNFVTKGTDPIDPPSTWSQTHTVKFQALPNYAYSGGQTNGFPNNCFYVQTQLCVSDATPTVKTCNVKQASTSKTQFVIKLSDAVNIDGIYYFAIGN